MTDDLILLQKKIDTGIELYNIFTKGELPVDCALATEMEKEILRDLRSEVRRYQEDARKALEAGPSRYVTREMMANIQTDLDFVNELDFAIRTTIDEYD